MNFQFLKNFKNLVVKCPPEHYIPKNGTAYRWVFNDMEHEYNFKPRYYIVPPHILEKIESDESEIARDTKICDMLALSMFESEQSAKATFAALYKVHKKKVYERFGTHVAQGTITENDGVNETPDYKGHFNHHPIKNHNYEKKFQIISTL
jgi:hypothetical protein